MMLQKFFFGLVFSAAVAAPTFAATQDQVGKYIGVVKFSSYNHDTGKKTTSSTGVELEVKEDNFLHLNVDGLQYLPITGNVGLKMLTHNISFGQTSLSIVAKFSGGKQPQLKGDMRLMGPSLYQEAKIKLKKVVEDK